VTSWSDRLPMAHNCLQQPRKYYFCMQARTAVLIVFHTWARPKYSATGAKHRRNTPVSSLYNDNASLASPPFASTLASIMYQP